jgi:hypothetical protein
MKSLPSENLWNRIDRLKNYQKSVHEVYNGAIRKIVEIELIMQKSYYSGLKNQLDVINKAIPELKAKNHFVMITDSLALLKDTISRKLDSAKETTEKYQQIIVDPIMNLLNKNEEIQAMISNAERNQGLLYENMKILDEKYQKFSKASQIYDAIFEEEQIKQQLKNSSQRMNKVSSTKMSKAYEKMNEEHKQYKMQVQVYNRAIAPIISTNVILYLM